MYKKSILIILTFLFLLAPLTTLSFSAAATGSYGVDLSRDCYIQRNSPMNPYAYPQCTWYCWGRAYEKLGMSLPSGNAMWGNANTWDESAEAVGFKVGTEVRANSIMVENSAAPGHVAFVEKVEDGYAYITEGNYSGTAYHEDRINLSTMVRDSWPAHILASVRYIYLKCETHSWDNGKVTLEADCRHNGEKTYTCTVCGEQKTETIKGGHRYKVVSALKANFVNNGKLFKKCSVCNKLSSSTVYRIKTVMLKKIRFTYNGKKHKPGVVIKDSKGKKISEKYYTVTYSGNKNAGFAKAKVKFKTRYSGTKELPFEIVPKGTTIKKVVAGAKSFTVKWKKQSTQTTGYQIQYATDAKFTRDKKTFAVKNTKTVSKKVSKLKNNKTYFVRVCTYKKDKNLNHFSAWSAVEKIKTYKLVSFNLGGNKISLNIPQNWISVQSGKTVNFYEKYNYEQYRNGNHEHDNSYICSLFCQTFNEFKDYLFARRYYGKIGKYYYSMIWSSGYGVSMEEKADKLRQEALSLSWKVAETFSPQPKTKMGKIKAAYFDFIARSYSTYTEENSKFATAYITKDDIPELIIYSGLSPHTANRVFIYTYKNGNVEKLGETQGYEPRYFKKAGAVKDAIFSEGTSYIYYKLKSGAASRVVSKYSNAYRNEGTSYYNADYRQITKSEFNKLLKDLVGSKKESKYSFRKLSLNTITKYLS